MGAIPAFVLNRDVQRAELHEAVLYSKSHYGMLPNDPFWRYVDQRFDMAVDTGHLSRFENYHPVITPFLERNLEALAPKTVPPHSLVPMPYFLQVPEMPQLPPCLPAPSPSNPGVIIENPSVPPLPLQGASTAPAPPITAAAVPEPASALLFGLGMVAVIVMSRKIRRCL